MATKVKLHVDLMQNTLREYDKASTYWHLDSMTKFQNIEVHSRENGLKFLCSISHSEILGF